jgi:esterase/lipase
MVSGEGRNIVLCDDGLRYAVGLGCLGIIYEITMVLDVRSYKLEQKTEWIPRKSLTLKVIERDLKNNFLVMYKTLPSFDKIERFTFNKIETQKDDYVRIIAKNLVDYQIIPQLLINTVDVLNKIELNSTIVTGYINGLAEQSRPAGKLISKSHHIVADASALTNHVQSEWAIDIQDVSKVLEEIMWVERNMKDIKLSEVHVRFSAKSSVLLNPAHNRRTAWIDFNTVGKTPSSYDTHVEYIKVLKKYGGRPHWSKQHFENGAYIESVYSSTVMDEIRRFRKLHDPNNILLSPYIQAVLSISEDDETFMNSKYGLTQVKKMTSSAPLKCVVLVPGFSIAYQDIFEPFASRLSRATGATVLTYNHFGRGQSTADTVYPYDKSMFVDILERIIDTYCTECTEITLLGVSMGGAIVGDYVTLRKDPRVKQLVLCAPYSMCGVPITDKLAYALPSQVYKTLSFDKIVEGYKKETESYNENNVRHITTYLQKNGVKPYYDTIKNYMNASHFHGM